MFFGNVCRDKFTVRSGTVMGRHVPLHKWLVAILKRGVIDTYHHWSAIHMQRYLAEFDMRYSAKSNSDGERAAFMLKGMEGRRLTYRRLISSPPDYFTTPPHRSPP